MKRTLVAALALGFVAVTTAWAFDIRFPASGRLRVKARVIVDEVGTILFGNTPAKVEVMNFPPDSGGGEQVVTLLDEVFISGRWCMNIGN